LVSELVEGTVKIEDVTERARELKSILGEHENVSAEELVLSGVLLQENVFEVNDELRNILETDEA
jgi:hypothetical protein